MNDSICKIPVTATYSCVRGGDPVMVSAQYIEVNADVIARFFIERLGGEIPGIGEGAGT